jgi:SPP1 gp7 family putative phage head morphogenesis protein
VTIREQLELSAQLGWQMGVDNYLDCIPREVWVKWAQWHAGVRESTDVQEMFRWASKFVTVAIDFVELLRGSELPKKSWLNRIRKLCFPAPTKERVNEILRSDRWPDRKTWPQRLQKEGLSFDAIINQVSTSMSQGKAVNEITKDLEPLVNNVRVRARRIARTESIRVGQTMQREADKPIDDMFYGRQILSVGDERVRPEHKERHGRIYYAHGWGSPGAPDITECPECPDAPNCRCTTYALIKGVHEIGLDHLLVPAGYAPPNVHSKTESP